MFAKWFKVKISTNEASVMKSRVFLFLLLLFSMIPFQALGITIVTTDSPLWACAGNFGYIDAFRGTDWSEYAWGGIFDERKNWAPDQAGLRIRYNHDKRQFEFVVRFQMSEGDINFFKNLKFKEGDTVIPAALEIDVLDLQGAFGITGLFNNGVKVISHDSIPEEALFKDDVSAFDKHIQPSAIIMNPSKLEKDTLYEIVFALPNHLGRVIPDFTGNIALAFQVSINYKWIEAMRNGYSLHCDILDLVNYLQNRFEDGHKDTGLWLVDGDYGLSIPDRALDPWYYFTAKTDRTGDYEYTPSEYANEDIVCWDDDKNSDHDDDGVKYCNGRGGRNLFTAPLREHYFFDGSNAGGSPRARGNNPNNREVEPEQEVITSGSKRSNGSPDISVKMTIAKGKGSVREHKIEQDIGDDFYIYPEIYNSGARIKKPFYIEVYVDGGKKKNFDFDEDDLVTTIKIDDFNSGAKVRYPIKLKVPEDAGNHYYYLRVRVDRDKNLDNNYSHEYRKETYAKLVVEEPVLDVDIQPIQFNLKGGFSSVTEGASYGFEVLLTNNGSDEPQNYTRINYQIKGIGTNNQWLQVGDDGTKAENLRSGDIHEESIDDLTAPYGEGNYTARACADYQNDEIETDESNNCIEFDFYVNPSNQSNQPTNPVNPDPQPIQRSITIISPSSGDVWRTNETHYLEWYTTNMGSYSNMTAEYTFNGSDWYEVDGSVVDDGRKGLYFCDKPTKDDDAQIRLVSNDYPGVIGYSAWFKIDKAKECKGL